MKNILSLIVNGTVKGYGIIAVFVILLGIVALIVIVIVKQKRFFTLLKKAFDNSHQELTKRYSKDYIIKKSRLISKFLQDVDINKARTFLYDISLATAWVKAISQYADKEYFKGILRFGIEEGYFQCFKHALLSEKLKKRFLQWLKKDESNLKKVAYTGNGQNFNGLKAYKMLQDFIPLIKEMIIYNDWRYRFFSLVILLNEKGPSTIRMISELFKDTESIIRFTLVNNFDPEDHIALQKNIFDLIIRDPNPTVRKAALKRYHELFSNFPAFKTEEFMDEEYLHLIDAFTRGNKDDEAIALDLILNNQNLEVTFAASHFLDKSGVLSRFSKELDLSDLHDWKRKKRIFIKVTENGATDFLKTLLNEGRKDTLLMLGEILKIKIDKRILTNFIKKAIALNDLEIYELAIKAASRYNGRDEKEIILKEFTDKINDKPFLMILIDSVKDLKDEEYIEPLIKILKVHRDLSEYAKEALLTKDEKSLITKIIGIVKAEDSDIQLKTELLFVIAKLEKEYCLSFLIENLLLIPVKWMSIMGKILNKYPKDILKQKVKYYLNQIDGKIRANLIALIPNAELKEFQEQIKQSLTDIDPLVRIASTFALIDIGDKKSIKKAVNLLRDPVEKVRDEVAYALARTGNEDFLNRLKDVFLDENEVTTVKLSTLKGLSECLMEKTTLLLLDLLEESKDLRKEIINALSKHCYDRGILRIIERLKDSGENIQKDITQALKQMGPKAKPQLVNILESELTRLKDEVSKVMDAIGGTDEEIKKLAHRDPEIRRNASKTLSLIQTLKAFRGLIIASRDPDNEVRINVIKAIEKLETDEGKEILHALENDPDPKIRKYTHWALERLKTKELV